jgi:hypothetical protein
MICTKVHTKDCGYCSKVHQPLYSILKQVNKVEINLLTVETRKKKVCIQNA